MNLDVDKITIVVAVYNIEKYVGKCIESIICQSYSELQIILVDDGSADLSGEICDRYAQQDSRIQVIHQKNQGLSEVRNLGIELAEGNWISFVDGDDILHPQFIEILYGVVVKSKSQIVICDYMKGSIYSKFNDKDKINNFNYIQLTGKQMLKKWHGKYLKVETVAWNKLYSIKMFDRIRYPKGRIHEDILTTHQLVANAERIAFIPEKLYIYIQRNESIKRNILTEWRIIQNIEAIEGRLSYFDMKSYPIAHVRLKFGAMKYFIYFYLRIMLHMNVQIEDDREIISIIKNRFFMLFRN